MKKKTILVVSGGTSSEREISLKSGKACSDAIKSLKYINLPTKFPELNSTDILGLIIKAQFVKCGNRGI